MVVAVVTLVTGQWDEEATEALLVIATAVCNAAQVSFRCPEYLSPPN